jgi:hypothetical protein
MIRCLDEKKFSGKFSCLMARIMAELGGFHSLEDKANYDCEKGGGEGRMDSYLKKKKIFRNRRHAIESCI